MSDDARTDATACADCGAIPGARHRDDCSVYAANRRASRTSAEVHEPPLPGDHALPVQQRHPVEPRLVEALQRLGEPYGPMGVALVAARLTDPVVLTRVLWDDRTTGSVANTLNDPRTDVGPVQMAAYELRMLTRCDCAPDWTDRGMHHPRECAADYRDDVYTFIAEVDRLRAELDRHRVAGDAMADRLARALSGFNSDVQAWRSVRGDAPAAPARQCECGTNSREGHDRWISEQNAPAAAPADGQAPADQVPHTDGCRVLAQHGGICGRQFRGAPDCVVEDAVSLTATALDESITEFVDLRYDGDPGANPRDAARVAVETLAAAGWGPAAAPADDTAAPDLRDVGPLRSDLAADIARDGAAADHLPPREVLRRLDALPAPAEEAGARRFVCDQDPHPAEVPCSRCSPAAPDRVTTDEVYRWHLGRFGEPDVLMVSGKLAEETGEVCGAIVKRAEGAVRPGKGLVTREDWTRHLHDEIGDAGIVLNVLAGREGTTLDELVRRRFRDDVALRTGQEAPAGQSVRDSQDGAGS